MPRDRTCRTVTICQLRGLETNRSSTPNMPTVKEATIVVVREANMGNTGRLAEKCIRLLFHRRLAHDHGARLFLDIQASPSVPRDASFKRYQKTSRSVHSSCHGQWCRPRVFGEAGLIPLHVGDRLKGLARPGGFEPPTPRSVV